MTITMTTAPPRPREPLAALLSPLLVALTTWLLFHVQAAMIAHFGGRYVRPYGIAYVLPVALVTAAGGYRAGLLTLALSALAAVTFLMPPSAALALGNPANAVELASLVLVGGLVVAGGEAMRRNAALLAENRRATAREREIAAREKEASQREVEASQREVEAAQREVEAAQREVEAAQRENEAAVRERETADRAREAAEGQRRFLREVLASVTDNRLRLCEDASELPACLTPVGSPVPLSGGDLRTLRQRACEAAAAEGFADERCFDLMTAVSEASMNAVVHAGGGEGRVCVGPDRTVQVRVADRGKGIAIDRLPRATLERGHSTAGTLGHGFWLMLRSADRLWLLTGGGGTTVVLEQERTPPGLAWQ